MTRVIHSGPLRGPEPKETDWHNYSEAVCAECGDELWVHWRTLKDKIPQPTDRFLCGEYRCKKAKAE